MGSTESRTLDSGDNSQGDQLSPFAQNWGDSWDVGVSELNLRKSQANWDKLVSPHPPGSAQRKTQRFTFASSTFTCLSVDPDTCEGFLVTLEDGLRFLAGLVPKSDAGCRALGPLSS